MKFNVIKRDVITYARNIDEVVEIENQDEQEKYLALGAIEPTEVVEEPVKKRGGRRKKVEE